MAAPDHDTATDSLARLVGAAARRLPGLDDTAAFGAAFDRFAGARIVLLGEATHGTSEFYRARAAITRRLIERHGFTILAIEADWPDVARIDRWVRQRPPPAGPDGEPPFARFPTWMWRNAQARDFFAWLHAWNRDRPPRQRAAVHGIDIYSLGASIRAVLAWLDANDPAAAAAARRRYGCLSPWQREPQEYGQAVLMGAQDPCESATVAQLRAMLDDRLRRMDDDGEELFGARQNARVVRAAEQYYRMMYRSGTESWNLRDRHMFDTLRHLLHAGGPQSKAVVWAHNSHIGNAAATAMGWQGEFNIGELCADAYGGEAVSIGFGTDRGTVAAATDWGAPMQVMQVRPARPDSHEAVFRAAAPALSLTALSGPGTDELRDAFAAPRLERAIGVIYRPHTELNSHYFAAVLPEQFDAFVWCEQTTAVTALEEPAAGAATPTSAAETYPFGV